MKTRDILFVLTWILPLLGLTTGACAGSAAPSARQHLPLDHILRAVDLTSAAPELVGARTTQAIPQGTIITPFMISQDEVIARNQTTTAHFLRGGVKLTIHVRALAAGRAGERIELINLASRKKITGIVQNDGTIHVY